ncbi:uncharacterized protein KZ484_010958 [Pholidichthys leucotaenia]
MAGHLKFAKMHLKDYFPQKHECKEEEVLADQQLWNQERNLVLDKEKPEPPQLKEEHEEPEPPQVKEEEEELCISQEGEQLVVKLEVNSIMVTLVSEEKQQSEAEPNSEQLLSHNSAGMETQDEQGSRYVDLGSTKEEEEEEPNPKKRRLKTESHSNGDDDSLTSKTLCDNEADAPQLHDCKKEEVLTIQQLWNQERNSGMDQEEQDAAQAKEEEGELCSSSTELLCMGDFLPSAVLRILDYLVPELPVRSRRRNSCQKKHPASPTTGLPSCPEPWSAPSPEEQEEQRGSPGRDGTAPGGETVASSGVGQEVGGIFPEEVGAPARQQAYPDHGEDS